jgi:hypothetical protein
LFEAVAVQVTGLPATSGYVLLDVRLVNVVIEGGTHTASVEKGLTSVLVLYAFTAKYARCVQSTPWG